MLRSLVGSEMCIRDSSNYYLHKSWSHLRNLSLFLRANLRDDQYAQSMSCLLYTSDAADDLLCVDLGGRRIIKKKNTHTYYQSQCHHSIKKTIPTTH